VICRVNVGVDNIAITCNSYISDTWHHHPKISKLGIGIRLIPQIYYILQQTEHGSRLQMTDTKKPWAAKEVPKFIPK
jgi:hypothetical protein